MSHIHSLPRELFEKHRDALDLKKPLIIIDSEAALFEEAATPCESAVVFLPKSKALIDMTLALASGKVVDGGIIVLGGEKKGGIESAKKHYESNIGPIDQKIVGNHSALYIGKNHRLGAGKSLESYLTFCPLSYKEIAIEATQLPGVFSAGELDLGTKLLLDTIPFDRKSVLDVGCGAGVIGGIYKKISPQSAVTMTDSSIIAVRATQETVKRNGLSATIALSDVFDGTSGTFDLIVTNPPFHSGIGTDYSFIERFARGARSHLNPGGEIYVVANSFLSYKDTLEKHIGPTEIVAETDKFRVFKSRA